MLIETSAVITLLLIWILTPFESLPAPSLAATAFVIFPASAATPSTSVVARAAITTST